MAIKSLLYLKPLATCRSPTTLKAPDKLKKCYCLQFAQILRNCLKCCKIEFFDPQRVKLDVHRMHCYIILSGFVRFFLETFLKS